MKDVYLALGSNVGDSVAAIHRAVEALAEHLVHIEQGPIYTSKAVGYTDQPDFYNTVLRGETDLSPEELLKFVKRLEQQLGRVFRFRWGPREIDIDIIFYDDLVMDTPRLTIPHPRFAEREFVLRPMVDIDPTVRDPRMGKTVQQLLDTLPSEHQSVLQKTAD